MTGPLLSNGKTRLLIECAVLVFGLGGFYAVTRSDIRHLQELVQVKADAALQEAQRKADAAAVLAADAALAAEVQKKADAAVVQAQYEAILRELAQISRRLDALGRP